MPLLIFIFLLILPHFLWAQNLLNDHEKGLSRPIHQFSYQNWTTEQGLAASALLDVAQTHDGYVWISSYSGISRFDGVNFVNFNRLNTPQITDNTVSHLLLTPDSTLWLATRAKGLVAYKNGIFKTYENPLWEEAKSINTLFYFHSTKIWISTNLGENYLFDYQKNEFSEVPFESLKKARIYQIKQDKEGYFWIASSLGNIQKCKDNDCQAISTQFGLPLTTIETIQLDFQQTIWAGTAKGLYFFDKKQNKFLVYKGLSNYHIRSMYLDLQGNLWVGTFTKSYRVHNKTWVLDSLRHQEITRVANFWEDKEGSLWIASSANGLFQAKSGKFLNIGMIHGLKFPTPQCFFQENENKYWIGGNDGTVQVIENGEIKTISFKSKLPNSGVFSILKDRKGNFWFSTYIGVLRVSPDGKEKFYDANSGLKANSTRNLLEDHKGNIWIATHTVGAVCLNPDKETFTIYDKNNGLASNFIMSIKENIQNQIIICANNGGISIIDTDKKIKTYTRKTHNLGEDFIFNVYTDQKKILWLASRNGLIRFDGTHFFNFNHLTSGLPFESIFDILEDDKGYFWLSANAGLIKVNKKQLNDFVIDKNVNIQWKIYDKQDGMIASECTGAVLSMKAKDGSLWFPTLKGITIVNPANFSLNKNAPLVNIHRLWVNDRMMNIHQKIDLKPQKYRLKFEYSALNFLNPNKIKFKIRLKGYEKEWIQLANERSATYTSLPYGEYTFQVLVCNEDEVWNEVGDSLTFSIQPYFYETWSFYILCGFFTIAIVIGVIRWRTYQVQHQNEKLENLVRERTSEIEQQKTEIQQKNEILNEFNEKITATLQTVELQNFEIQDKNKNITDSINYAKRIQTAMLSITSFEYILGAKNFFILFKPRDIVSGDFYWIAQLKEKIIITVADCTGHGVPGAFVSMVGNSFLNEIVLGEGFSAPQVILKRLHKKIVDFFHQQENLNELVIDDGMDIVILTLQKDTQTQKIVKASYSGAMNPLYYVQNQQLFEIKASKKSIGGWRMTESRAFEMHEIDLDSPTIFYLCTDGYQDQFGGEKGKKFMVKNLKEKLLSLHSKELLEQKNDLDLTINNWISSAKEAQTDDITIVGVKVGE